MGVPSVIWKTKRSRQRDRKTRDRNGTDQVKRRSRGPERLEPRRLLAADPIHVGVVYLETDYLESDQDVGSDSRGDRFILSFTGGAPDTELSEIRIRTDKDGDGISVGDPIYDTALGGRGKNGAHGFQIVRVQTGDGRQVEATAEVEDGGQELVLRLSNFHAGDRLEFTVDVDEVLRNAVDLAVFNDRLDVITSGQEFQDSILEATFDAPHYEQTLADAVFLNDYGDPKLSHDLELPPDEGSDIDSRPNRSAAAVASATQQPKPIEISGHVWIDNDLDLVAEPGEELLANVEIALWKRNENGTYIDTQLRSVTDAQGRYSFPASIGLLPGIYRLVQVQPDGLVSVGAVPGTVQTGAALQGTSTGTVESSNVLTNIDIPLGDSAAINYDFAEAQPASLSGYVYRDPNNNGVRETGEPGIAGVRVQLIPINTIAPQSVLTVTSAGDGSYSFTGLAPGSYEVIEVDQPTNLNDGIDSAGTVDGQVVGVAENPGDRLHQISLRGGDVGVEFNFGEVPYGSLSGFVYLAAPGEDCAGQQDTPGSVPLSGVQIALQTHQGFTIARTTTGADGGYTFDEIPVGNYRIVEFTPNDLIDGSSHVGRIGAVQVGTSVDGGLIQDITMTPAGVGIEYNFCEAAPASISGYVYNDQSNDGIRDSAEPPIQGVDVGLIDDRGQLIATVETDINGRYLFKNVRPGDYSIVERQPAQFIDGVDSIGTVRGRAVGVVGDNDTFTSVTLNQGDAGVDYNFGELRAASLFGRVHVDNDGDCELDAGESTLAGVAIRLLDSNGSEVANTVTDAAGQYSFVGLTPGDYTVVEEQPTGFFEGGAKAGTAGGAVMDGSRIGNITLTSGETATGYDFCERPPAQIQGNVFNDRDGDCLFEAGESGIEGVRIELYADDGKLVATAVTDPSGAYRFTNLPAGQYTVREIQPAGWLQGGQVAGSAGGDDSTQDSISRIPVGWGDRLTQYNFCELEPASISGIVYADRNGDCVHDAGEPPIEGVTIELRDGRGRFITSTTTDANGRYSFSDLAPGSYQVFEYQPDGFFHGGQRSGTGDGEVLGDDLLGFDLTAGETLTDYQFCELEPASISGVVHVDDDGDCIYDSDEAPLEGVAIELRDASGNVVARTTTSADGRYSFDHLAPGDYQIFEVQPENMFQGGQKVGTGIGTVLGDDLLGVTLMPGDRLVNYDFCELPPASLSGFVHVDDDGDCVYDPNERPLEGVAIELRDSSGAVVARTTTNANGLYRFEGLPAGVYEIFEQQPEGLFQGGQTPGTGDGRVLGTDLLGANLSAGQHLVDYNFCEVAPSSISGRVWQESDLNQQFDPGDTPIAGVLVELIDDRGDVVGQQRTGNDGEYAFTSLAPGVYSVRETQPAGFFHGGQVVGNSGGNVGGDDLIVGIELFGGTKANHYDFPEVPPATISGFVFQDGDAIPLEQSPDPRQLREYRDGRLTEDDTRLQSVTLELRNVLGLPFDSSRALAGTYDDGPIRVTTDANGYYEFTGLRPGTYHVYQVQPDDYIDGLDTAGTTGGLAVNPADEIADEDRITIQTLAFSELTNPNDDAILNISLVGGGESEDNNFSEIVIIDPDLPPIDVLPNPTPESNVAAAPLIEASDSLIRLITYVQPTTRRDISSVIDDWAVSWHLSVINGGFPRGTLDEFGVVRGISIKDMREHWSGEELRGGRWTFANNDGTEIESASRITLGDPEGIALAGDFDGDGSDEAVIYVAGQWFVDLNGNGRWDAGDLWIRLGNLLDRPVVGDWDGDGKDDIGIFGRQWQRDPQRIKRDPGLPDPENKRRREIDSRALAALRELQDADQRRLLRRGNDGSLRADAVDHVFQYGEQVDTPVSGDWNGDGIDQIAVFREGKWLLDADGDGRWTQADDRADFGQLGDEPVVGDFNGDEIDEIGVVRGNVWIIDTDGDRRITGNDLRIVVPRESDDSQPVVGDFDGDGKDEPGYYDDEAA